MKKHLFFTGGILLLLSVFLFTSCEDEGEDLYHGFGLVNKKGENGYTISLDQGGTLYPEESVVHVSELRDSMRLYVLFNVLEERESDADVRIVFADTLQTKPVLTYDASISDSVGNAPVKITDTWLAHGFLNFKFLFAGRINMSDEYLHMVNLLQCPSEEGKLVFEFRHNDFGDRREKIYSGIVSFPVSPLVKDLEKPVKMIVRFKDSEHTTQSLEITYK